MPDKIKEDGGIKTISIKLTYYVSSDVNDKDFQGLRMAFEKIADQVKEVYKKSGVKSITVDPVIEQRTDFAEANKKTPDVQISLKR